MGCLDGWNWFYRWIFCVKNVHSLFSIFSWFFFSFCNHLVPWDRFLLVCAFPYGFATQKPHLGMTVILSVQRYLLFIPFCLLSCIFTKRTFVDLHSSAAYLYTYYRKFFVPLPQPLGLVYVGKLYLPLATFCFVSMGNGVNLINTLNGLAGGISALAFIGMSVAVLPINPGRHLHFYIIPTSPFLYFLF